MIKLQDNPSVVGVSAPYGFETRNFLGQVCLGGIKTWYRTIWKRKAGCGPTTASNLFAQLARQDPRFLPLCPYDTATKAGFLSLMNDVWQYITPTLMGVNTTEIFASGAVRYAGERGITLKPRVLDIPLRPDTRPAAETVGAFIEDAFAENLPVAFLNLCNGGVRNLDKWHWVTLVSVNRDTLRAEICDQGKKSEIDLALWLRATTKGGGFVVLGAG